MMRSGGYRYLLVFMLLHFYVAATADVPDSIIHISKLKGHVYQLLEHVSKMTGKMFVYDSDVIRNDRKSKIDEGDYTVAKAVSIITGRSDINLKSIGNHIVISAQAPQEVPQHINIISRSSQTVVEGRVIDYSTRQPLAFASVGIKGSLIGSVANGEGLFRIVVPDSLTDSELIFSFLGYQTRALPVSLLRCQHCTIELHEYITTLQEIVVRLTNPMKVLSEMRAHERNNYFTTPVITTSFYREGTACNGHFVKLSEGVFHIYKPSIASSESEEVKLLKMRNISRGDSRDTIVAKMKAGIGGSLLLDLIRHTPDFLEQGNLDYNYFSTGITTVDDRTANIIYFEQKHEVDEPLFCGELFIDSENYALLGADFEINPEHVKSATEMFIARKSSRMDITPQKISYHVNYKKRGEHYYINYVRGDLLFKAKVKGRLWGSSHIHLWMEMATCDIDTVNVSKFGKNDQLPKFTVFEDTHFVYDNGFWEDFNTIPIDKDLMESIGTITLNIEEKLYR